MATATKAARRNAATATSRPKTSIGAKARAAAANLRATASEHLNAVQFGRHAASSNLNSVKKNNAGDTGYMPRHAAGGGAGRHQGSYDQARDTAGVISSGGGAAQGRHARNSWFSR